MRSALIVAKAHTRPGITLVGRLLRYCATFAFVVTGVLGIIATTVSTNTRVASAATNSTINFQARILTASGALVPDGDYNVEFKIYDSVSAGASGQGVCSLDSSTDDCLWVETRTGVNTVRVVNGYVSANLGSVTAFGAGIPWDQDLYVTMRVGSIGAPSWDTEMVNPTTGRMKISSVPYALRAGQLARTDGASTMVVDLSNTSGFTILSDGTNVFNVGKTGRVTLAEGLVLANSTSTTAGTIRWSGTDFEGFDGSSWLSLTSGGGGGGSLTFASFYAYDAVGGIGLNGGFTDITLDTEVVEDTQYTHAVDGSTVTINEDGTYEVSYDISVVTASTGNSNTSAQARLQENTGGGFVTIPGSTGSMFVRGGGSESNASVKVTRTFVAGDVIKLQAGVTAGTLVTSTVPNSTNLTIRKVTSASGGSPTNAFVQNGNDFGTTAVLGTQAGTGDGLTFITNGSTALSFTSAGAGTFSQVVTLSSGLSVSAGDITLSGNISGANTISATSFSGNGSSITGLNASSVSSGTLDDTRLSVNVALLNQNQTFSGDVAFSSGLTVGNSTSTTAGALRFTGSDFEGFDGVQWVSLTSGGGGGGGGSSSPAHTSVVKPANETVTASTTLQPDNHLVFPVGANETWSYRFVVQSQTPVAAGIKFAIDAPAGSTCSVGFINAEGSTTQSGVACGVASAVMTGTGTNDVYEVIGSVTTSATAGNVTLQWAQGTASGSTTVLAGSYLHASVDGGGMVILQGGNEIGGTVVVGSKDAGLTLISNNSAAISIAADGTSSFSGDAVFASTVQIGSPTTTDPDARITVVPATAGQKGLVLQGTVSQTGNLLEVQGSTGGVLASFASSGALTLGASAASNGSIVFNNSTNANTITVVAGVATAARSITLPDADGTICISGSAACGFLRIGSGSFDTDATTNSSVAINKTGASGNIMTLQKNGADRFVVANDGGLTISTTSTAGLIIRTAGGVNTFSVDTSGNIVRVGNTSADATGVIFVLDNKNTAGDPAGENGAQYYNSLTNKFRCFQAGAWRDCLVPYIRSFVDSTADAIVDANTTNYWDIAAENNNSTPNITPTESSGKAVLGTVSVEMTSSGNGDTEFSARVERGIGSVPTCGSGTNVGANIGVFSTNNGGRMGSTVTFVDTPNTTSQVFYTLCSDAATAGTTGSVTRIRVTLEEVNNVN